MPSVRRIVFVKFGDAIEDAASAASSGATFDGENSYFAEILGLGEGRDAMVVSLASRRASARTAGVRLEVLPLDRPGWRPLRVAGVGLALEALVAGFAPDLVVCVDVGYVARSARSAAYRAGAALVLAIPGQIAGSRPGDRWRRHGVLSTARWEGTRRVLGRGNWLTEELVAAGVPAGKTCAYFPRYTAKGTPQLRGDEGRRGSALFVGRLAPVKGIASLPSVATAVACAGGRLRIVGDGPGRGALEAELSGSGATVMGAQSHAAVMEAMRRSRVLVMPSQSEGIGKSAIEAAISGLPVVAYDVGGIGDWVKDGLNGILVPYGDTDRLCDSVVRVLQDEALYDVLHQGALAVGSDALNLSPTLAEAVIDVIREIERDVRS
jgi:glycosyltransferase involved in cell wall biosynthesis